MVGRAEVGPDGRMRARRGDQHEQKTQQHGPHRRAVGLESGSMMGRPVWPAAALMGGPGEITLGAATTDDHGAALGELLTPLPWALGELPAEIPVGPRRTLGGGVGRPHGGAGGGTRRLGHGLGGCCGSAARGWLLPGTTQPDGLWGQ
jgi:hypothetical protein